MYYAFDCPTGQPIPLYAACGRQCPSLCQDAGTNGCQDINAFAKKEKQRKSFQISDTGKRFAPVELANGIQIQALGTVRPVIMSGKDYEANIVGDYDVFELETTPGGGTK